MPHAALRTLLPIAGWSDKQAEDVSFTGGMDPVLPTPFRIGQAGAATLAAYQVEIKADGTGQRPMPPDAKITLVGVEGGEHAAFKDAPHYDPAALHEDRLKDRIILAAFNTGADLPAGKTRVARIHVQVEGPELAFKVVVMAAATADGTKIDATATAGAAGDSR